MGISLTKTEATFPRLVEGSLLGESQENALRATCYGDVLMGLLSATIEIEDGLLNAITETC
jgi:hypothetical protein